MALVSARQRGLVAGLGDLVSQWTFDRKHGLEAFMPREVEATEDQAGFRPADSVQYQGVDPGLAREVLLGIPAGVRSQATFVDYGCGKGRGLAVGMLAGFPRLVGVEVSPELAAACDRNLRRLRERHPGVALEIRILDAARYEPPGGPLVAFLYNPFLGPTLDEVAGRLGRRDDGHPVWVAYVNPRGRGAFPRASFLERAAWEPSRAVLLERRLPAAPTTPAGSPGS
jgi:hypothetical protein